MSAPLSAVVITLNAAAQLRACLESLAFAQEIIVVDSGSSDGTIALAQAMGARVVHKEWLGFGRQKQFAVAQAANDWVLCLDADERVSAELRAAIQSALAAPAFKVYEMPRRNRFMGRWLRHGEGYPDFNLRLFHRDHARWSNDDIHEHVVTATAVGRLDGDLLHESETSLHDYIDKQNRYTTLQAQKLFAAGRRATHLRLWLNPLFRFIKFYVVRRGFLDGVPGFVHIVIGCQNSFLKYAKLRQLCQPGGERR